MSRTLSRWFGPPASNRQYHKAKTKILVIQSAAAETQELLRIFHCSAKRQPEG